MSTRFAGLDVLPVLQKVLRVLVCFILPVLLLDVLLQWVMRMGLSLRLLPILPPDWWLPGAAKMVRIFCLLHLNTGIGLVLALLPVAAGLVVFAPRRGLWIVVAATALVIATHPMLYMYLPKWSALGTLGRLSVIADLVKQALALPLLTWLAGRLLPRWGLGGTGTARQAAPPPRRAEGAALVGLLAVLVASLQPLYFVIPPGAEEALRFTVWSQSQQDWTAGLTVVAPLLAGLSLLFLARRPALRRGVLVAAPLLVAYGAAALALEAVKPMILARIKAPAPAPGLWNLDVVGAGGWNLLAAVLLLLVAWLLALRRGA